MGHNEWDAKGNLELKMLTFKNKKDLKWTTLQFKEQEKEQTKPKGSRKKEIIKVRTEINKIEIKRSKQ